MGTMVVGFRLGSDVRGRQATLVLTQAGVLHHSTGVLGMTPRPAKPHASIAPDPHPVPRQAAELRKVYAALLARGYTRELIAPACVPLETDEHPPHEKPYGPHAPRPHPELIADFTGAAPAGPGSLEDALATFYTAIGLTPRPRTPFPPGTGRVPARAGSTAHPGRGRSPDLWPATRTGLDDHSYGSTPVHRHHQPHPQPRRSSRSPGSADGLAPPPATHRNQRWVRPVAAGSTSSSVGSGWARMPASSSSGPVAGGTPGPFAYVAAARWAAPLLICRPSVPGDPDLRAQRVVALPRGMNGIGGERPSATGTPSEPAARDARSAVFHFGSRTSSRR